MNNGYYCCRTLLEDLNAPGFSRDQFGRQSMSEKRRASLDAKHTDTYQRNKKIPVLHINNCIRLLPIYFNPLQSFL